MEISSTGVSAPVDVSAWTTATSLGFDTVRKASAICCGAMMLPQPDQVHEAEFHARATGAADRESHLVARKEHGSEHALEFLHHLHEHWIEVADQRLAHGAEDLGGGIARAGAHQQAGRGFESGRDLHGGILLALVPVGNQFGLG